MMIFLAFLISLFGIAIMVAIRKWDTKWYMPVIALTVPAILIFTTEHLTEYSQTNDTEYWTGYVETAEHHEYWNEKVPCRHPHYKTVTKTRPKTKTVTKTSGSGKNARTTTETVPDGVETYTEQVQDGWEHLFDVDEHPEYWECHDNNGKNFSLTRNEFDRLAHKFGSREYVHMNHPYYTINGNKYVTKWKGEDHSMEVVSHTHSYENRIMASHSILKFRDVDKHEKESLALFDYPEVKGYSCPMILGYSDPAAQQKLEVLNARLGKSKQIRIWICVFKNQPLEAGYAQEAIWQGGNKNELVLLIGVDEQNKVQWGHTASWTLVESVKVNCRNAIYEQEDKTLNLSKLIDNVKPIVETQWERRHFKEFKYLEVDPPAWSIWLCFGLTILTNGVIVTVAAMQGKK